VPRPGWKPCKSSTVVMVFAENIPLGLTAACCRPGACRPTFIRTPPIEPKTCCGEASGHCCWRRREILIITTRGIHHRVRVHWISRSKGASSSARTLSSGRGPTKLRLLLLREMTTTTTPTTAIVRWENASGSYTTFWTWSRRKDKNKDNHHHKTK